MSVTRPPSCWVSPRVTGHRVSELFGQGSKSQRGCHLNSYCVVAEGIRAYFFAYDLVVALPFPRAQRSAAVTVVALSLIPIDYGVQLSAECDKNEAK